MSEEKMTLKQARESKGITQKFIADELGLSRQTVNVWENNIEKISISNAKRYCRVIGVDINDIFFGEY